MSFLIRLSHTKLAAVIAILAMLMLFIAPDISRNLHSPLSDTQTARQSVATANSMSAEMTVTALSAAEKTAAIHPVPAAPPMTMPGEDVCGYCVLLHMPILLIMMIILCNLSLRLCREKPCIQRLILPAAQFAGDQQPRAPPASEYWQIC